MTLEQTINDEGKRYRFITEGLASFAPERLRSLFKALTLPVAGFEYAAQDLGRICELVDEERSVKYWKNWIKRSLPLAAGIAITAPISLFAHEALHAATNKLLGGVNYQIYMSPAMGGELVKKIIPYINTNSEFAQGDNSSYLGRAVMSRNVETTSLEGVLITAAPYLLSVLGAHLVNKGIREKDLFKAGVGISLAVPLLNNWHGKGTDLAYIARMGFYQLQDIMPSASNYLMENLDVIGGALIASITYALAAKASDALLDKIKPVKKCLWKRAKEYSIATAAALTVIIGLVSAAEPLQTTEAERLNLFQSKITSLERTFNEKDFNNYFAGIKELQKEFPEFNYPVSSQFYFAHAKLFLEGKETLEEALSQAKLKDYFIDMLNYAIKREEFKSNQEALKRYFGFLNSELERNPNFKKEYLDFLEQFVAFSGDNNYDNMRDKIPIVISEEFDYKKVKDSLKFDAKYDIFTHGINFICNNADSKHLPEVKQDLEDYLRKTFFEQKEDLKTRNDNIPFTCSYSYEMGDLQSTQELDILNSKFQAEGLSIACEYKQPNIRIIFNYNQK